MDFDVVIATVPDNYDGFRRFAAEKGARFAIEVGNVNQPVDRCDLILDSTGQYPGGVPFTPEFDIDGAFAYTRLPATVQPKIMSFVNLFPGLPCYPLFEEIVTSDVARSYVYGHEGPDGLHQRSGLGHGHAACVATTSAGRTRSAATASATSSTIGRSRASAHRPRLALPRTGSGRPVGRRRNGHRPR
jgi:hypothetical protein